MFPISATAPKDHNTQEFLDFLKKKNKVFFENDQWLVIENKKYHTKKLPWYTAIHKPRDTKNPVGRFTEWYEDVDILWHHFPEWRNWQWLKKERRKSTIFRFHIHILKAEYVREDDIIKS